MKLKNMWKRFWTLDVHNHEGFTLVELIIVIAILAILSTGAIAGYSAYVEKANKTADIAMLSEIENVLLMAYYNGDLNEASLVLDANGVVDGDKIEEGSNLDLVMDAAYGENWRTVLKVKWDGWLGMSGSANYVMSNFMGNESELIRVVDNLTSALGEAVANGADAGLAIGGEFESFIDDLDIKITDKKAVGNAAVLYVALKTEGKDEEINDALTSALRKGGSPSAVAAEAFKQLNSELGSAAAMAAIFAYAEGYAQATGQADKFHTNTDFSDVKTANEALAALGTAFDSLDLGENNKLFNEFIDKGQGTKNLNAYVDMMGTVNQNKNLVSGNLKEDDCFTDGVVEGLLKDIATMSVLNISTENGQAYVGLAEINGNVVTDYGCDE